MIKFLIGWWKLRQDSKQLGHSSCIVQTIFKRPVVISLSHQALSWPRRSCERAPCRPCWWADSSWWARYRVGCVSAASTEWAAPPSTTAATVVPEPCTPRPLPRPWSLSCSAHPVEVLLSHQNHSGLRYNLAPAPSAHCAFCCASWCDRHAPYENLRKDIASAFHIQAR